jgi:hypothetical protein
MRTALFKEGSPYLEPNDSRIAIAYTIILPALSPVVRLPCAVAATARTNCGVNDELLGQYIPRYGIPAEDNHIPKTPKAPVGLYLCSTMQN